MGLAGDEFVEIQLGKKVGEPCVVTVNCPDKTGLCCDLCRIILEFGLCISRGDVSTDGQWCFVVLWVVPCSPNTSIQWESLKNRLLSECPSFSIPFYLDLGSLPKIAQTYLLKLFSINRDGLLHDVTHVLCELDLCVHRVKVSTTPEGKVMDLFFITDGMEQLHTRKRQDETRQKLSSVLGDSCITCDIELAEGFQQGFFSSLPPNITDELFNSELTNSLPTLSSELAAKAKKVNVAVDNSLSPCHTLLQIHCLDQKGLLYDILRTLKDHNIRISYGRFMSDPICGFRDIDLFIQHTDGKKLVDPEKQVALCSKLRLEMLYPLKVFVANRGPDSELLVANSVELSGKGRPRVFYDVTLALKKLGICIFSAEIGKLHAGERQWEVYRFLLEERGDFPLSNFKARISIINGVHGVLMGW